VRAVARVWVWTTSVHRPRATAKPPDARSVAETSTATSK
jgi:hypothetical protein